MLACISVRNALHELEVLLFQAYFFNGKKLGGGEIHKYKVLIF